MVAILCRSTARSVSVLFPDNASARYSVPRSEIRLLDKLSATSFYMRNALSNCTYENTAHTTFTFRASPRACAPISLMSFSRRSSETSPYTKVCGHSNIWTHPTWFNFNALARCCAPASPMLLPDRFNKISVYTTLCRRMIESQAART